MISMQPWFENRKRIEELEKAVNELTDLMGIVVEVVDDLVDDPMRLRTHNKVRVLHRIKTSQEGRR